MPSVGKFLSGVVLKKATIDDVEAIAQIHIASWKETYQPFFQKVTLKNYPLKRNSLNGQVTLRRPIKITFLYIWLFMNKHPLGLSPLDLVVTVT